MRDAPRQQTYPTAHPTVHSESDVNCHNSTSSTTATLTFHLHHFYESERRLTRLCPFTVLVQHPSGDGDEGDP